MTNMDAWSVIKGIAPVCTVYRPVMLEPALKVQVSGSAPLRVSIWLAFPARPRRRPPGPRLQSTVTRFTPAGGSPAHISGGRCASGFRRNITMRVSRFGNGTTSQARAPHPALGRLATWTFRAAAVCACLLFASSWASAQGTSAIAGIVRDSSGGVLPGVTVEAASPALIEKVRSVVSDAEGQYKLLDLPGGTYTVTFSLTGFSTLKREGLVLTANFTANVAADMKVGALEETITVSGQAPVVDVQTTAQHKVVSADVLYSLPLTKEMGGFAKVTVGARISATAQDVGGNIDPMNGYTVIHGGHFGDNRALLDGMHFNGEGQGRGFYFNPAAAS